MQYFSLTKKEWDSTLENLLLSYAIFANLPNESGTDYELIQPSDITSISYNIPKPATPLKSFFLPSRENVTSPGTIGKPRIIIGVPNCDIETLTLLDSIYLDRDFEDIHYRDLRENVILISSDCFSRNDSCHCLDYGIKPYATSKADIGISVLGNTVVLRVITNKGLDIVGKITSAVALTDESIISVIDEKHKASESSLMSSKKIVPDYLKTGILLKDAGKEIWKKYSGHCVSCGACAAICPTCTCFLLIDKPGFEKVKSFDSCQYPAFERVAGGEDALFSLPDRFRNRYMCKYVWRPGKFNSIACTGCGRCIDACIGRINKNELISELAEKDSNVEWKEHI
jgi:formate hydrogenlyase subunit 6/NADH:ubiquinone oxidoreductase subunit I